MFEGLCPYMAFPMRLIFANLWLFAPLLKTLMPKINPMAGAMLGTMCSFNTINGGKYGSVQAKTVEAGAYLRCIDDKDLAQDIAAFRTIAEKYGVEVTDGEGNEYHAPADLGKPAYDYVRECVADVFPHVACAPFILPAGTDARWLTDVCQCVIRFAPIDIDPQQFASVHSRMRILILRRLETPSRFINGFFGSTIEPILRFLEAIKSETAPVRLCCRNGAVCFMLPLFQQGLRHSRPYRIFLKLLCFAAQYDSISEQGKITPPMMRPWAENRCCPCSRML